MRTFRNLILSAAVVGCVVVSCSKSEREVNPDEIAQTFSENLEIEGATRHKGDIPVPSSGSYGFSAKAFEPNVNIEVGENFTLGLDLPDNIKGGIIFLKMEGSDDYFEIQMDENNRPVNTSLPNLNPQLRTSAVSTSCPICNNLNLVCCPTKKCGETKECPSDVPNAGKAIVQVASPPKKNGQPDRAQLNDKKYWSPPIIFTINIKVSIPECKAVENELNRFIGLINAFQANPTSASCNSLKASALKLFDEMKKCPKFKDDANLAAAVDAWKSLNCSGLD